ncbi:unnamed protein product [Caretta caretta]
MASEGVHLVQLCRRLLRLLAARDVRGAAGAVAGQRRSRKNTSSPGFMKSSTVTSEHMKWKGNRLWQLISVSIFQAVAINI